MPSLIEVLDGLGEVFEIFDQQDSGHISYGVKTPTGVRLFVKTPGSDGINPLGLSREQRSELLQRAASVQRGVVHPALIPLVKEVETDEGVLVAYEWFSGELLRSSLKDRDLPTAPGNRFAALDQQEVKAALNCVLNLHVELERRGWLMGDFYDGCLMYDFTKRQIKVMDFECYQRTTSYVNGLGRLPGSTRFMAPEEFELGATIDARTAVFNLGRMLEIFVSHERRSAQLDRVIRRAVEPEPEGRWQSVAELAQRFLRT